MPVDAQDVIEAKRLRFAAREVFDAQKEMVRADMDAAGLGKRIASRLADDGRRIAESAQAEENRPIVAVGALALAGWFLRRPIGAFIAKVLGEGEDEHDETPDEVRQDVDA